MCRWWNEKMVLNIESKDERFVVAMTAEVMARGEIEVRLRWDRKTRQQGNAIRRKSLSLPAQLLSGADDVERSGSDKSGYCSR